MLDYQACFERPGDITLDGMVNVTDLLQLLADWGLCDPVGPCPSDIAPSGGDGTVNVTDLLTLLGDWGPCI